MNVSSEILGRDGESSTYLNPFLYIIIVNGISYQHFLSI